MTEYLEFAKFLESVVRRANNDGPKSRKDILDKLSRAARSYRKVADQMDAKNFEMNS